jgi:hypothetical protein
MNKQTKGNYGWLDLQRMTLPFTTMNRHFPKYERQGTRRNQVTMQNDGSRSPNTPQREQFEQRRRAA